VNLNKLLSKFGIYVAALIVFLIIVFPIYSIVLTSIQNEEDIRTKNINFIPSYITLEHYKEVFKPGHIVPIKEAMGNSFLISFLAALFSVSIAVPAAYALARDRLPKGKIILYGLTSSYVFPAMLFLLPIFVFFVRINMADTHFTIILLYVAFMTPFLIWVLKAFVEAVPEEVEQAARLDGCNHIQLFGKIYLPVMRPGIAAAFLYAFILSWIEFLTPLIFTAKTKMLTVSLGLYRGTIDIKIGQLSAAAVLSMVPVIILTIIFAGMITQVMTGAETK